MALRAAAVAALVVVLWAGVASAAVYEVGDKTGWTIMGNPDYAAWASSKKFHLGDTVVFTYNKQFHDVLAVSKADYKNCGASKPMATWSTGNDSVVLNTTGHHYFLCGFPGHCAAGQKVDIRVASSAAPSESPSAAPSPTPSGSKPSGGATTAPSPHPNAAPKALSASSVAATVAASLLSLAVAMLA
ncbi:mavicyanin [Miscanthus floridulus]|uniref:mavicyanin n=1 Tax=Miscanthus floridulus TaxID=154761 RepID=UPI0034587885